MERANAADITHAPNNASDWTQPAGSVHDKLDELADRVTTEEGLHPDTSTDNAIVRFDGTTGKLQDGQILEDDSGNLTEVGNITADGTACTITQATAASAPSFIQLSGGTGSTGTGGTCNVVGGAGVDGGACNVKGGVGVTGDGGTCDVTGGQGGTDGGALTVRGGSGSSGDGGDCAIRAGTGGTNDGDLLLQDADANTIATVNATGMTMAALLDTDGNDIETGGIVSNNQHLAGTAVLKPVGISSRNVTQTTGFTDGDTYFAYIGRVTEALSSVNVIYRVTTAQTNVAGVPWGEIAIYKGTLVANDDPSGLTRLGYTDTWNGGSGDFTSTGVQKTSVSLSGHAAGDDLWVAFGGDSAVGGNIVECRALEQDDIQSGVLAEGTLRPSTSSTPSPTLSGNTRQFVWCKVIV